MSKSVLQCFYIKREKLAVALNGVFSRSITVGNDDVSFMAINNSIIKLPYKGISNKINTNAAIICHNDELSLSLT